MKMKTLWFDIKRAVLLKVVIENVNAVVISFLVKRTKMLKKFRNAVLKTAIDI